MSNDKGGEPASENEEDKVVEVEEGEIGEEGQDPGLTDGRKALTSCSDDDKLDIEGEGEKEAVKVKDQESNDRKGKRVKKRDKKKEDVEGDEVISVCSNDEDHEEEDDDKMQVEGSLVGEGEEEEKEIAIISDSEEEKIVDNSDDRIEVEGVIVHDLNTNEEDKGGEEEEEEISILKDHSGKAKGQQEEENEISVLKDGSGEVKGQEEEDEISVLKDGSGEVKGQEEEEEEISILKDHSGKVKGQEEEEEEISILKDSSDEVKGQEEEDVSVINDEDEVSIINDEEEMKGQEEEEVKGQEEEEEESFIKITSVTTCAQNEDKMEVEGEVSPLILPSPLGLEDKSSEEGAPPPGVPNEGNIVQTALILDKVTIDEKMEEGQSSESALESKSGEEEKEEGELEEDEEDKMDIIICATRGGGGEESSDKENKSVEEEEEESKKSGDTEESKVTPPLDGEGAKDSDSEDESNVGKIRIRNFNTLKEDDASDSEDDVVELPKVHTQKIWADQLDQHPDLHLPLDLECGEEKTSKRGKYEGMLRKVAALKKLVGEIGGLDTKNKAQDLQNGTRIYNSNSGIGNQGSVGINVTSFGVATGISATRYTYSSATGGPIRMTTPSGTNTQSRAQLPISIMRNRLAAPIDIRGNSGPQQYTGVRQQGGGGAGQLGQLLFDPTSGLLLYPSPMGDGRVQAVNPNSGRGYQKVQSASQLFTRRGASTTPGPFPSVASSTQMRGGGVTMYRGSPPNAIVSQGGAVVAQPPRAYYMQPPVNASTTVSSASNPPRPSSSVAGPSMPVPSMPGPSVAGPSTGPRQPTLPPNIRLHTLRPPTTTLAQQQQQTMRGGVVMANRPRGPSPSTRMPAPQQQQQQGGGRFRTPAPVPQGAPKGGRYVPLKQKPTSGILIGPINGGGVAPTGTSKGPSTTANGRMISAANAPAVSSTIKLVQQALQVKGVGAQGQRAVGAGGQQGQATSSGGQQVGEEEVTAGTMQPLQDIDEGDSGSRTFPSLVVMVKPCLQDKLNKQASAAARADLDLRVKTILMYSPSRFTEYLLQQGLIKAEHKCTTHPAASFKLGRYSDGGSKHPFSGGYVWITDCCPDKQVSVFQGSIFESSVYPPGTLMKLMYHWACQTPASSTLQWVKVTSYYLKNFYTLLRSACVAALHENSPLMGGRSKYVEIGIITLGTTVQSHSGQKNVKIEILGVFDPASKNIRLKVINPQNVGVADVQQDRITQILWPLNHWVDKRSVILIDNSMDKTLLNEMGFSSVSQTKGPTNPANKLSTPTNVNVMNYLKNIVPKMFQNTLCVLSKSLIQQFLDELSWREMWGGNSSTAFDNMVTHLVQMTRAETGESLISRLNKISLNPFQEWSYSPKRVASAAAATGIECLPDSIRDVTPSTSSHLSSFSDMDGLSELAASYLRNKNVGSKPSCSSVVNYLSSAKQLPPHLIQQSGSGGGSGGGGGGGGVKRKAPNQSPSATDLQKLLTTGAKVHCLQNYYYVYCSPPLSVINQRGEFPFNLKCPLCSKFFTSNVEAFRHVTTHVLNVGRTPSYQSICNYCLKELPQSSLQSHVNEHHKLVEIPYACRICNFKFNNEQNLVVHMWQHHVQHEAPYRCEVCEMRSSFHHEIVDHFNNDHLGMDCVQCPLCLKVLATKSFACLKMLVVHMQSHMLKKGKKCSDCTLVFCSDIEMRTHFIHDLAHESRPKDTVKSQKGTGNPIWMAKPPKIPKSRLPPPPPAKKAKMGGVKLAAGVTTLNSSLSVPINPNEKFTFERFSCNLKSVQKNSAICYECDRDIANTFHYTGVMKCNRCRYSTSCPTAMTRHSKAHDSKDKVPFGPQRYLAQKGELGTCPCSFQSQYPDHLAFHMSKCGYKTAKLASTEPAAVPTGTENGEVGAVEEEFDPPPPVLVSQV